MSAVKPKITMKMSMGGKALVLTPPKGAKKGTYRLYGTSMPTKLTPLPAAPKVYIAQRNGRSRRYKFEERPRGFPLDISRNIEAKLARNGLQEKPEYRAYVNKLRDDCAAIERAHLIGMLKAVGNVLHDPRMPATTNRFHVRYPIWISEINGGGLVESGRVSVGNGWPGLNKKYMESKGKWRGMPESKSFWRKTGKLSSYYDQWLGQTLPRLRDLKVYTSKPPKFTMAPRRGKAFTAQFYLNAPSVDPYYMNYLLNYPFATRKPTIFRGIEHQYLFRRGGPNDIRRLLYPEYVRPWVSLFASRMGAMNLKAIERRLGA